MIEATALKNGKTFEMDGKPYLVLKYEHMKMGRGSGNVKLKLRNLETGDLAQKTMSTQAKFEEILTVKKPLQYLFNDGSEATFMDEKTFIQVQIPLSLLGDQILFVKEGEIVNVLFWDDRALSIDIAPKVTLTVTETPPGVKGNSATNVFKNAKMENGLEVKVPLFIKNGDKIRVDTRSGEYLERVND